ncbi:prepilin peptidase [Haladaptatus sp. F3-133]|uniref:Prepilin peptidase n=1 Tax=Halorutilus salinus TaxID=2487751 RepID=A0A9Q4GI45_9EURY|nr:A24 family peptidase [Halorutilus salinus]MCX2818453.1 prepilin peptidase [Halorutilus salinus]
MEPAAYVDAVRVLAAVSVFAYASYLDIRDRRVPHRTWYPLVAVGAVALVADLFVRDPGTVVLYATASLALGAVFGYGFYYLGTFGGADRYALVVLGFLFPVYPSFPTPLGTFPVVVPDAPFFVLSVLGNTVLAGIAYPASLFVRNAARRDTVNPALMALGRRVTTDELHDEFGRIIGTDEDVSLRGNGVLGGNTDGIRDIDFVRDYVDWADFDSLRGVRDAEDLRLGRFVEETAWESDDLRNDAEELRELASHDAVWISPGIPFIVPIFAGLLVALTVGDVLFIVIRAVFGL